MWHLLKWKCQISAATKSFTANETTAHLFKQQQQLQMLATLLSRAVDILLICVLPVKQQVKGSKGRM